MIERVGRISRLEVWRDIVSTRAEPELDQVIAGRDAELALRSMLSDHLTWRSASIFHSKRLPRKYRLSQREGGGSEIDLIVLSHKQINAIEIKNWSGSVRVSGADWIQERRNGEDKPHDNPISKNQKKLDNLCRYLTDHNIKPPRAQISRVIFWNKNLRLPVDLARRDEVVMHHELDRFLSHQRASGFGERFLMSVLAFCLEQEAGEIAADGFFSAIPTRDYDAATRAVSELGTFDKLELYGGRVLSGDLLKLRANGQSIPLKELPSGKAVRVECVRNKLVLFFVALLGSSPMISLSEPYRAISASPRDRVLFQPSGQKEPEEFELSRIVSMVRG